MATPKVGGEVDALCTRCKMNLAHTILAMVGTRIARVRCNTCGGDHSYRSESSSSPSRSSSSSSTPRTPKADAPEKRVIGFEQQLQEKDLSQAKPYRIQTLFAVGDVVSHPTFGFGIVSAVRGDKVDVTFKAMEKTLIHGRGEAPGAKPTFSPPPPRTSGPADKPQSEPAGGDLAAGAEE